MPAILGKFIIEADCLNIKNGSKLVFIGIDITHDFHQPERRPSVEFVIPLIYLTARYLHLSVVNFVEWQVRLKSAANII